MRTPRTTRTLVRLFGLGLLAALSGCYSHALMASFPEPPAGADRARVVIRRYYQHRMFPDLSHGWRPVGEVEIGIPSLEAHYLPYDSPPPPRYGWRADDGSGGEFVSETGPDFSPSLYRDRPDGGKERITSFPDRPWVDKPHVAVGSEGAYVFLLSGTTSAQGNRHPDRLVRVNVETKQVGRMDLPPDEEINDPDSPSFWEELFAAGPDEVVLVGRARHSSRIGPMMHRTWCGNFSTGKWTGPIDGAYRPLDSTGALVEVRRIHDGAFRREKDPNKLWWIDDEGGKHVVDLGHAVEVVPVFGTRYVMSWDPWRNEVVLQSLTGEPEKRIRVPDSWE